MNRVELKNIIERLLSRETDQNYKQIEEIVEMLVLSEMHTAGRRLPWLIRTLTNVQEKMDREKFWEWKDWREKKFKIQGYIKQYGVWVFPEEVESPSQEIIETLEHKDS